MSVLADSVYAAILARGEAGQLSYYDRLRRIGVAPTPSDEPGHLYAPNPVVVPRETVAEMTADLERFCAARRAEVRDGGDLLAPFPAELRRVFASPGVAARLHADLERRAPFACLDAYLVEAPGGGLAPAYLEWQTFPAYPTLALDVLGCLREAFPEIEAAGAGFSPRPDETLEALRERMRGVILAGVEDDPRTAVLVDYQPARQETRREFFACQRLTGGEERGVGILDPREVRYRDGRPCYERDGRLVPIRAVFSRLVHDDLERLLPELAAEERGVVGRFFREDEGIDWRVHPLHFLYGSKADFPSFARAGLSRRLPECRIVTPEVVRELCAAGRPRVSGFVQKPVEGHGGRAILLDPAVDELEVGALLQRVIEPAACHRTLAGPRAPEVRVMGVPGPDGKLFCSSVFTRVKAPAEFRSNAGVTARAGVAGTGEGYAVLVGR